MSRSHTNPKWRARLAFYRPEEQRGITFLTPQDLRKALKLFWGEGVLYGVPRNLIGGRTIVLPVDVLGYLKKEKIRFKVLKVRSFSEIPAHKAREIRRKGLLLPEG